MNRAECWQPQRFVWIGAHSKSAAAACCGAYGCYGTPMCQVNFATRVLARLEMSV
jgi:hypothetical protein